MSRFEPVTSLQNTPMIHSAIMYMYTRNAQPADREPDPALERVTPGPRSRLRNTKNLSWMTESLWMNLNFIELLTILQLIAIRNSTDRNNIKP